MSRKSRSTSRVRAGSKRGAAKVKTNTRRAAKSSVSLLTAMREHVRAHGENYLRDPNITSVGVG